MTPLSACKNIFFGYDIPGCGYAHELWFSAQRQTPDVTLLRRCFTMCTSEKTPSATQSCFNTCLQKGLYPTR